MSSFVQNRNENQTSTPSTSGFDLRSVVINKRQSALEAIWQPEDKIEVEIFIVAVVSRNFFLVEFQMHTSTVRQDMDEEDKELLLGIEQQKLKREEILRLKEWKRDSEVSF